jgi:hypothetical protein
LGKFYLIIGLLFSVYGFSQKDKPYAVPSSAVTPKQVATIDMYKIISISKDTTAVDTSLTIQKEYRFNYLRKDIFGLMPFANEGQTYNTLQYSLKKHQYLPEMGFSAKHFNFMEAKQIQYYHVPTPYTELYYRSVMEQGQNVDAFITINTSKNLNFFIGYKGLRSIGKYINSLASTGNFRFGLSYQTEGGRYALNTHVLYQDILNNENGGITNHADFESDNPDYKERGRLDVNLKDASTLLKGRSFFSSQVFRLNKQTTDNNWYVSHELNAEAKFFQYKQTSQNAFFGDAYIKSGISDFTNLKQIKNKFALDYDQSLLGKLTVFAENLSYNYYYNKEYIKESQLIPHRLSQDLWFVGTAYTFSRKSIYGKVSYTNGMTDASLNELDGLVTFQRQGKKILSFGYQKVNKQPNHIYSLYQSSYLNYNWYNQFKTEKINRLSVAATVLGIKTSAEYQIINDYLYFSNDGTDILSVTPKQYGSTINYWSVKIEKEFKVKKWALDNTLLIQQVKQDDPILNVPQYVLRNTLYYTNSFFKKALQMQMGVTANYFSAYYANNYNPVIGEFYVQQSKKIGDFPVIDIFVNAKIKTAQVYLKAEHFNSSFSNNNFYAAPAYPYRDFIIRFGIIWRFFS